MAAEYNALGFRNAKALQDGVKGWQAAGFPLRSPN
jgi:rhodanese-related sulfurtransferase